MLRKSFPRKDLHGNGARGVLPKRHYTRTHLRKSTVSFPSLNSLKSKIKSVLRCDVEGGQRMDGLAIHAISNPKHPEGLHWGPKSFEISLQEVMHFVYVFC